MEITENDIKKLKKLDRIEYRQRYEGCCYDLGVFVNINTLLLFIAMGLLFSIASRIDNSNANFCLFMAYLSAYFSFLIFLLLCSLYRKKQLYERRKIEELNKEYFKITEIK